MEPKYDFNAHLAIVMEYPYSSEYLYALILDHNITDTSEIQDKINQIQEWLDENVNGDREFNYKWSHNGQVTTLLSSIGKQLNFSTFLRFRFEEDLLAFRLRFGINR